MNCNECLSNLEEYVEDGLESQIAKQTAEHVAACQTCRAVCEGLENEREIYSRYLLKIKETPESWNTVLAAIRKGKTVASKTGPFPAGVYERFSAVSLRQPLFAAMAALLLLVGIGLLYRAYVRRAEPALVSSDVRRNELASEVKKDDLRANTRSAADSSVNPDKEGSRPVKETTPTGNQRKRAKPRVDVAGNKPDENASFFDASEAAFNRHLGQCELVLRSFRNAIPETNGSGFDISYERRLSKELFKNSIRFRRVAESQNNPQVEKLLVGLEALLGDIAKLHAKPTIADASAIKERIQESGMIARLQVRSLLARATH